MHFPIFLFIIREADNNISKPGDETKSIERFFIIMILIRNCYTLYLNAVIAPATKNAISSCLNLNI